MVKKLGKQIFPVEFVRVDGSTALSLMSAPLTVYERTDGSCFYKDRGRRMPLIRQPDGSFLFRIEVSHSFPDSDLGAL